MRYIDILNETKSTPVIVVDVQPVYHDALKSQINLFELMKFLNSQTGNILMFINGDQSGLSDDSEHSCIDYWQEYGLDDELLPRMQIIDKGYGYLRPLIDAHVSENRIIAVIRAMYQSNISDSRDFQEGEFEKILGSEYQDSFADEAISVNWLAMDTLKRFSGCYICGGGKEECLKEVQLMMNAFNIKYREISKFIY